MRGIAEFSQILGMAIGLKWGGRYQKAIALVLGVSVRCAIMSVLNIIVLPIYYAQWYTLEIVITLLPLIALFNAMIGTFSILVGYLLYETYTRRVTPPS
jgi:hypothetical protein